jgi:predicted nucleic acid-binding protein
MIALGSNIFIYWLERNPEFYELSAEIIKQIHADKQQACCSILVLTEIYSENSQAIKAITNLPNLSAIPVTQEVAELAGKLRYTHGIKVIDSVHAASALHGGADTFLTNDIPLSKKEIPCLTIKLLTKAM